MAKHIFKSSHDQFLPTALTLFGKPRGICMKYLTLRILSTLQEKRSVNF